MNYNSKMKSKKINNFIFNNKSISDQTSSLRVLHYIKHLETGGGENLIFNIYNYIDRSKIQFDFAVNTAEEERLDGRIREMGGRIYPICECEPKLTILKLRATSKGLGKLLKAQRYDIVHIHCSNGQGLHYSNIARQCGVKNIICHIHNTSVVGRFEKVKKLYISILEINI